ncbi:SMI1/KNR4 family protein [Streptomyces gardneri]|uniref:SMI1/KNR4 family protein n=1 Tax=Streptomyces gardneri TaxID=66892 RepID=UPI0035E11F90
MFGPRARSRPVSEESWREIERSVGVRLPEDYKRLVDGYGDATVFGHLGIPHPESNHALLEFIEDLGDTFLSWQDPWGESPEDPDLARMIPWAFHSWNGDICLLDPPKGEEGWSVVVAYRQFQDIGVFPGTVTEFLVRLRDGRELPREWPPMRPDRRESEESPLI